MAAPANFKRAAFDAAAGNIALVAAVSGKKIALHAIIMAADTADGTFAIEDGSGGTRLIGRMEVLIDQQIVLPFSPVPWAVTSVNTVLNLEATTTGAAGVVIYAEID